MTAVVSSWTNNTRSGGRIGRKSSSTVVIMLLVAFLAVDTVIITPTLVHPAAAAKHERLPCPPAIGTQEDPHKLRVMPLGDSISICCHRCGVDPAVLPTGHRHRAEPAVPYEGYIKKLWRMLFKRAAMKGGIENAMNALTDAEASTQAKQMNVRDALPFRFVGTVTTCMKNATLDPRLPTDDWEVRYEGRYGAPTKKLNRDYLLRALDSQDPDVVLLHIGTNDLTLPKYNTVGWGRAAFAMAIMKQILGAIMDEQLTAKRYAKNNGGGGGGDCPRLDPQQRQATRHLFLSLIIPYDGSVLGQDTGPIKRGRVDHYNKELLKLVAPYQLQYLQQGVARSKLEEVAAATKQLSALLNQTGSNNGQVPEADLRRLVFGTLNSLSRIHVVDMYTNFSARADLHGDGLHPNDSGERKIASRYFEALAPYLEKVKIHFPHVTAERTSGGGGLRPPVFNQVSFIRHKDTPIPSARYNEEEKQHDGRSSRAATEQYLVTDTFAPTYDVSLVLTGVLVLLVFGIVFLRRLMRRQ